MIGGEAYMQEAEKLGEEPIGHLLLANSVHSSIALLAYGIYGITDMLIVSWGVNETAAGAVAFVSPIMLMLNAVSTTMGTGGAALISRALGKKDLQNAAAIAANVFLVFWFFAILLTVAGLVFLNPILGFMGVTENIYPYAKDYAEIILLGAITSTAFSSLIRAEGAMRYALKIWLYPVIVNLALDSLFVYAFGLAVSGAALATIFSQLVSICMYIWFFFMRGDWAYEIKKGSFRPDFKIIKTIAWLGLPSLITQLSSSVYMILTNRYLGLLGGGPAITAMGFALKIQAFLTMPQSGIIQGMQPLLGYNDSNGRQNRVGETIRMSAIMSFSYGLFVAGIAVFFGRSCWPYLHRMKRRLSLGAFV